MRELEIRRILGQVCQELDLRAAARRSAASAVLGASLIVNVACSDDPGLKEDADAAVDTDSGANGSGTDRDAAANADSSSPVSPDSGAVAMYMNPIPDDAATGSGGGGTDLDAGTPVDASADASKPDSGGIDGGAVAVYSVPFDAGPVTKYGVPEVDAAPAEDAGQVDAGAVEYYGAPVVDAGPMPDYMAQPVEDAGTVQPVDSGSVMLYLAVEAE